MLEFARLPISERAPYFVEAANRRRLSPLFVEKDFWVCFSLHVLFTTPALADKFVFKGGTSLSKVFGVIKRFSEDVDLSIDPEWLGFGGENRPDAARSRSHFEKRWKKLNDACATAVEQKVQPALECAMRDALGPATDAAPYLAFKWLKDEEIEDSNELPEPEELATDAIAALEAAVGELNAVLAALDNGNGEKVPAT